MAKGAEQKALPSGLQRYPVTDSLGRRVGFAGGAVLHQFDPDHESDLSDISYVLQYP